MCIRDRNFKKLIAHALANAQKGDKTAAVAPIFEDGSYRAQMKEPEQGWTEFVVLTIQNNAVTQISFDAVDENGAYKSKDADYQNQMVQAGSGTYPAQFYPAIIQSFIEDVYKRQG